MRDEGGELLLQMARSHCGDVRRELLRRGRLKLRELDVSGVHLSEAATKRVSAGEKSGRWGSLGRGSRSRSASGTVLVDLDVLCGCQFVTEIGELPSWLSPSERRM